MVAVGDTRPMVSKWPRARHRARVVRAKTRAAQGLDVEAGEQRGSPGRSRKARRAPLAQARRPRVSWALRRTTSAYAGIELARTVRKQARPLTSSIGNFRFRSVLARNVASEASQEVSDLSARIGRGDELRSASDAGTSSDLFPSPVPLHEASSARLSSLSTSRSSVRSASRTQVLRFVGKTPHELAPVRLPRPHRTARAPWGTRVALLARMTAATGVTDVTGDEKPRLRGWIAKRSKGWRIVGGVLLLAALALAVTAVRRRSPGAVAAPGEILASGRIEARDVVLG